MYLLLLGQTDDDRTALRKILNLVQRHIAEDDNATLEIVQRVHDSEDGLPLILNPKVQLGAPDIVWTLPEAPSGRKASFEEVRNCFSKLFFMQKNHCVGNRASPFRRATDALMMLRQIDDCDSASIRQIVHARCEFVLRNPDLLFWRLEYCDRETDPELFYRLLLCICADRHDPCLECDKQLLSHVQHGPTFVDCLLFIGRLYTFEGRFDEAIQFFERTLVESNNVFALYPCHGALASLKSLAGADDAAKNHLALYFAFSFPVTDTFRYFGSSIPADLADLFCLLKQKIYCNSVLWPLGELPSNQDHFNAVGTLHQISRKLIPLGLDYIPY
jgi:tetratricopeptide (TPR) repeat protein